MHVRGLVAALNASGKYKYKPPESVVDHLVIGGGVVGLAIARRLSLSYPDKSTFLVERHSRAGEETSSRNSEVIHAGLYYPPNSLKTRLCLRGRHLLYDYCEQANVPYKKTGKLVLARAHQEDYLHNLHAKACALAWPPHSLIEDTPVAPMQLLNGAEVRELEPDISEDITAALLSPETGIVDSHGLMANLEKDITDSGAGALVYSTRVVRVDPYQRSEQATGAPDVDEVEDGWVVQTVTGEAEGDTGDALLARTLINASGLSGALVLNALLEPDARIPMYYARGSYASYRGPGAARVRRLLYPVPDSTGSKGDAFQSLGTHLTLDLDGNVRFGPDLEWIDAPPVSKSGEAPDPDFWAKHLVADGARIKEMHAAVTSYLPGVTLDGLQPDYAGLRPKLIAPPKGGFQDFVIRKDYPAAFLRTYERRNGQSPMISLLGIESPGLTSCLALAEMVVEDMLKHDRTAS